MIVLFLPGRHVKNLEIVVEVQACIVLAEEVVGLARPVQAVATILMEAVRVNNGILLDLHTQEAVVVVGLVYKEGVLEEEEMVVEVLHQLLMVKITLEEVVVEVRGAEDQTKVGMVEVE